MLSQAIRNSQPLPQSVLITVATIVSKYHSQFLAYSLHIMYHNTTCDDLNNHNDTMQLMLWINAFLFPTWQGSYPCASQIYEHSKLGFQIWQKNEATSNIRPGRKGVGLFLNLLFFYLPNLGLWFSLARVKLKVCDKEPVDVVHTSGKDSRVKWNNMYLKTRQTE